jgi:hypothetical protein
MKIGEGMVAKKIGEEVGTRFTDPMFGQVNEVFIKLRTNQLMKQQADE